MTAGNAILIVAIVTGLGLIGALFFVMFKIRQISREFFGTSSLIEGLKRQEALEDDTPKSVSGMTRVELPRIEKDFPEFHWPEWKQRCENQLKGYLEALEHRDLLPWKGVCVLKGSGAAEDRGDGREGNPGRI